MTRWAWSAVLAGVAALTSPTLALVAGVPSYADEPTPAACRDGVTVVVDHGALGGGVTADCQAAVPGNDADTLFRDSGLELDYVRQQPTFICRVNGEPAADPCVMTPPQDAYWGLWWRDDGSSDWHYATVAASGLSIPAGGAVALVWQDTAERVPPDVAATTSASSAASSDAAGADAQADTDDGFGLPTWVGPAAVLAVAAAAGAFVLVRRTRS